MIDEGLMLISVRHLVGPILCHKLLFKISVALTTLKHFLLWCLLFNLQTSVRGQNGVEFYQESTGHIRFFLALLLAKIANERLKILVFLLFDLQTSVRAQVWVLYQKMYFIYILWVLFILISFKLKCQGFNLFILLLGFSFQCFSLI